MYKNSGPLGIWRRIPRATDFDSFGLVFGGLGFFFFFLGGGGFGGLECLSLKVQGLGMFRVWWLGFGSLEVWVWGLGFCEAGRRSLA